MSGLHIAVVLLGLANVLQFYINVVVRRRLDRLEAGQRCRAPDLKPEAIASAISPSLAAALDRLDPRRHE